MPDGHAGLFSEAGNGSIIPVYMKKRKKLGIALGSGGPKGLYHVGVLKTLIRNDIPIDLLAGSSVGSWVGAHYALYKDLNRLEELTNGRKIEKLLSMLEFSFGGGFLKGERLGYLLNDWLKGASFSELQIPFRAVATDLATGAQVIFRSGKLMPALRASMAIPGIFEPVPYHKRLLTDGGISNPVPDDIVRAMGADVVLAVDLNGISQESTQKAPRKDIANIVESAIDILYYHLAIASTRDADFTLRPSLQKYSSWKDYFMTDIGNQTIALGERDAKKIIPALRRKLEL